MYLVLSLAIGGNVAGIASTITQPGSDLESLFTNVGYVFATNGSNAIKTNAFGPSATGTLVTSTGVSYINYASLLPVGSTLTGATLDFSGLFGSPSISETHTFSCTGSGCGGSYFTPAFSASLGAYTVTISSGAQNVNLSGASAIGYDLWPTFSTALLAGNTIQVQWSAPETFSANTAAYANNCKNCTENFTVTDTRSFTASNTANALHLVYSAAVGPAVPEPGISILTGSALVAIAALSRRARRNRGK
jgi:hypothetical protein